MFPASHRAGGQRPEADVIEGLVVLKLLGLEA